MPITMERSKRGRKSNKVATIVVGKMIDTSADELENLITDEKDHALMVINKTINLLKKNNITTISQLKELYNTYGEKYVIKKLSSLPRFGKKTAEDILTNAVCYTYPKGYIPKKVALPDWITEEVPAVKKEKKNKKVEEKIEASKPEEEEEVEVTPFNAKDADEVSVNIADYSSNLIEEKELVGLFLKMVFDLFEEGSGIIPERVNPNNSYDQINLLYTDTKIFIMRDYCRDVFDKKFKNIKTVNNFDVTKMWYYALNNCLAVYKMPSKGTLYCWGRKNRTLGYDNMNNYVEIDIAEAERFLNRELNMSTSEEIDQIMADLNLQPITVNNDVVPVKSDFYIIPTKCKRGNFEFEIMKIENRLHFDTYMSSSTTINKGVYSFDQSNVKNGELLIGRGYSDHDYDEIKRLAIEFLSK